MLPGVDNRAVNVKGDRPVWGSAADRATHPKVPLMALIWKCN